MESYTMMAAFQMFIGGYLIYSAITGKGQAFNVETIRKEDVPQYIRYMRIFCTVTGPICLIGGVACYFSAQIDWMYYVALSTVFAVLACITVLTIRVWKMRRPVK